MTFDLEPAVTLPWLVRLRWAFLAGQLIALPIAWWWFGVAIDPLAIGLEIAIMAASNIALSIARRRRRWLRSELIGAVMALDTALITLLLWGSGGSANPFTMLYLVHITLSAIVLRARWTIAIAALSLAGFALLFAGSGHASHAMMHDDTGFALHLQAMWAAFALAAVLIAFFVARVTRAIASQRDQIALLREASERSDRIAAVTRLAAGAAHELGSPLATIAVAAHEAKLHAAAGAPAATVVRDLELIALEVERCQNILGRMAAERSTDVEQLALGALADRIRDQLGEDRAHRVDFEISAADARVTIPRDQLVQSVAALVTNALEATRDRVVVKLSGQDGLEVEIRDRGDGIAREVLERIGTPFFTTKQPGRGLGLGVFLARSFCESRGGGLTIESQKGVGTRAVMFLPAEPG